MTMDKIVQEITSSVIAILAVIGTFLIVFYQLEHNQPVQIPDIATGLIFAVVGAYFSRVASVNGARQAGTAAAQTVVDAAAGGGNAGLAPPVSK